MFLEHLRAQLTAMPAAQVINPAPRTLDELNRYAAALIERNAKGDITKLGFAPQEPGWYIVQTPCWFGGKLYDEQTGRLTVNGPANIAAMDWIRGFSERLGPQSLSQFTPAPCTSIPPRKIPSPLAAWR